MSPQLQANGTAAHVKAETPPVAKPIPAIASVKAEPVPQTAKSDDGKEFLYATKVSMHGCHAQSDCRWNAVLLLTSSIAASWTATLLCIWVSIVLRVTFIAAFLCMPPAT